mmetsp:Transcript_5125/g.10406  ORF Transcript_5125/g.10406 Transcript_5125/m.10406 type:complete len:218 (+) Transcript_5125:997-1650(+)
MFEIVLRTHWPRPVSLFCQQHLSRRCPPSLNTAGANHKFCKTSQGVVISSKWIGANGMKGSTKFHIVLTISHSLGQSPFVLILRVSIKQRFNFFLFLPSRELVWISTLEEARSQLNEPFGFYGQHFTHILLRRVHHFMVNDPFRLHMEKRGAWVNIYGLTLNQCLVSLLGVFLGCMDKVTGYNGFPDLDNVAPSANDVEFVTVHDCNELLANLLSPL